MSEEDVKNLKSLTARLDAAIQPLVESSGGAFVKFSTRRYECLYLAFLSLHFSSSCLTALFSPKDAALVGEKMKDIIREGIEKSTMADPYSKEAYIEDIILFTR